MANCCVTCLVPNPQCTTVRIRYRKRQKPCIGPKFRAKIKKIIFIIQQMGQLANALYSQKTPSQNGIMVIKLLKNSKGTEHTYVKQSLTVYIFFFNIIYLTNLPKWYKQKYLKYYKRLLSLRRFECFTRLYRINVFIYLTNLPKWYKQKYLKYYKRLLSLRRFECFTRLYRINVFICLQIFLRKKGLQQ